MATFGAIQSANPNVLFDPAAAMGAAQAYKRNDLMMQNAQQDQQAETFQRDATARIGLARQMADLPDDVLAKEWGPAVQRMQQAGLGQGLDPASPPPRERLQQIASSDLTTFQKMQGEHLARQDAEQSQYHQGVLAQQQAALSQTAAHQAAALGQSAAFHRDAMRRQAAENGVSLVPIGAPAPAAAGPAGGAPMAAPPAAPPAAAPAGPQMGEAGPAPEISGPAARLGGVDVAGPGAPPAPPAGPPPGTKLFIRNGQPITAGLPTGQAWGQDANGQRVVVDIPGARLPGKGDAGPAPPIGGNGLDSALLNILVSGDPSSPQYAAAFARLGAEEVMANGVTRRPDMSPFRQPTYRPPGVMEPGQAAAAEPQIPQGGRAYGKAEVNQAPVGVTPQAREAVRKVEQDVTRADEAIGNFLKVHKEVGGGGLSSYLNNPSSPSAQRLLGAFESMKVTLRNEAFLNTGVLQPAEAKMLDDTLLSPTTLRGAFATTAGLEARMDEIRKALKRGVSSARRSAGIDIQGPTPDSTAEPPPRSERPPLSSFGR